jgi:hypothetical protein
MSSQGLSSSTPQDDDTSRSLLLADKERAVWEKKLKESIEEKSVALQRSGELEARCLESARQMEELKKTELLSLNQQIQETRAQHLESIEGHIKTEESLRRRLKELEAAEQRLPRSSAMPTTAVAAVEEGGISTTELQAKLLASEQKIEELKTQILTLQVKHQEIVVDHLKSNEDLKGRLQEVEAAHDNASKEVSSLLLLLLLAKLVSSLYCLTEIKPPRIVYSFVAGKDQGSFGSFTARSL